MKKCIVKNCKKLSTMIAPADLCKKHWDAWWHFKLIVSKRKTGTIAYFRRAK